RRCVVGVEALDVELSVHYTEEATRTGLVTIAIVDITERNRARAAQEHAEFMYRNLFHGMAVAYLRLDSSRVTQMFERLREQGVADLDQHMSAHPQFFPEAMEASIIVEANNAAVKLYGARNEAELLGPLSRVCLPGEERVFRGSLAAGYAQAPGHQAEARLRGIDGRELDVLVFTIATPEM